jgi:hypothetical protein
MQQSSGESRRENGETCPRPLPKAFSSEVETGSREENASTQEYSVVPQTLSRRNLEIPGSPLTRRPGMTE